MSDVLVIQNTRIEGSGNLGYLLENDGFDIHTVYAKSENIPFDEHSMLIVLGGPESANDDLSYLRKEEKLIRNYVENQKPVLGICLGSQLIAKSFGAQVLRGPRVEIGFYHDLQLDSNSKLFSNFSNPFSVFHWHGDTFDLPKDAIRLVHSKYYANQAFQIGTAVGIQFHLEVNQNMINLWLDNTEEKIRKIPYIEPEKIRNNINENISQIESNMENFYKNFKSEFHI